MQDLNDMVFFAEVVERGGFAAAGRALGVPKSRLSRRVAELEARLGVQLLQRSTRRLSLTPAGEIYLRHCAAMRDAAQAAAEAVAQVQTEPRGTVRLSCPVTLAQAQRRPAAAAVPAALSAGARRDAGDEPAGRSGARRASTSRCACARRSRTARTLVAQELRHSRGVLVASPALLQRQGRRPAPDDLAAARHRAMSAGDGRASWHARRARRPTRT